MCFSRRKEYTLSLKQGKKFSYKAVSPLEAVKALFLLGKEVFQAQDPFFCGQAEVKKLHAQDRLSQQV